MNAEQKIFVLDEDFQRVGRDPDFKHHFHSPSRARELEYLEFKSSLFIAPKNGLIFRKVRKDESPGDEHKNKIYLGYQHDSAQKRPLDFNPTRAVSQSIFKPSLSTASQHAENKDATLDSNLTQLTHRSC